MQYTVCNAARLLLTLPATNATSERTFSTMRRLKTYLRSTMSQTRLKNVMILSIHKELVSELDLHDIVNQFVSGSEPRLRVFGNFWTLELDFFQASYSNGYIPFSLCWNSNTLVHVMMIRCCLSSPVESASACLYNCKLDGTVQWKL